MRTETCITCGGTGTVNVLERYERAHQLIDYAASIVERGFAPHLVSVDVEGSYPIAVPVRDQTDLEAVESELGYWRRYGDDILLGPLNTDGWQVLPIDPRFYEVQP